MQYIANFIFISLIILSLWSWRYRIKPYFANKGLQQHLKNLPNYPQLKKMERLLNKVYQNVQSKRISQQERQRLGLKDDAFVYGEIEFLPFFNVLSKVGPLSHELFYDLGSGAGKAVLTAACYFKLAKACGIEKLSGLHETARSLVPTLHQLMAESTLDTAMPSPISFLNDDFLQYDFTDGDIIFINATCLHYYLWEQLLAKLILLKPGSRVIVTTKKIDHPAFQLIHQSMELMSWGMNSVNIYRKGEL